MSQITVFLAPDEALGDAYFMPMRSFLDKHMINFKKVLTYTSMLNGTDAAEDAFDVSNNPYRQEERSSLFGKNRSLSVGDVVLVDELCYMCAPSGWNVINT
jgi:hypothetical protein